MLRWTSNYFVGDGIQNPKEIQAKIELGKHTSGIYLLTLSNNKNNLMELLPAKMLRHKNVYERCPEIFGMAKGKEDAIGLTTRILMNCYRANGNYCLEEYLKNR